MNSPSRPIVNCPRCGAQVEWAPSSRWRPFCSERCKLIDLGDWASERFRIAAVDSEDDDGTASGGEGTVAHDD
jgi:endogenous inhibitor of DNA gyrase (YacG/DUF329 family)